MLEKPILSIVVPTIGNFTKEWIDNLQNVKGNVEFILITAPGFKLELPNDKRIKLIVAKKQGELIQRLTGLQKAKGKYILSTDDDDLIHPDIASFAEDYFNKYPDSWVLRPGRESIRYGDIKSIDKGWPKIPSMKKIIKQIESGNVSKIPIVPLDKVKFDFRFLFWPLKRKGHHGRHIENFNSKIWKNDLVQKTLPDLEKNFRIIGNLRYIPFWCLDRLMGLYLQAKHFKKDVFIGHWPTHIKVIRKIDNPSTKPRSRRFYVLADMFLVKRFPKYGYFWNMLFDGFWGVLRRVVRFIK